MFYPVWHYWILTSDNQQKCLKREMSGISKDHFNLCKSPSLFCFHQQWSRERREILFPWFLFWFELSESPPTSVSLLFLLRERRERGREGEETIQIVGCQVNWKAKVIYLPSCPLWLTLSTYSQLSPFVF